MKMLNDSDQEISELGIDNEVFKEPNVINVDHSTDVIIGTVTQFHGPVTILQNQPISAIHNENQHEENNFQVSNGKGSLAKSDSTSSETNESPNKFSIDRKKILYLLIVLFILVATVVVVLTIKIDSTEDPVPLPIKNLVEKVGDHKIITRDIWAGMPALKFTRPLKTPVKYVLISHTAGNQCLNIAACSAEMRQIQAYHVSTGSPDIGYNFLIGGDENIYVGRGWDIRNFHDDGCIGISFLGNYVYNEVSDGMVDATKKLLERGVSLGKLDKDYFLVAHNQTYATLSPGQNVYNEIKKFEHFLPGSHISWD